MKIRTLKDISHYDNIKKGENKMEGFIVFSQASNSYLHNVCLDIRLERREFDAFNKEFDEKYKDLDNDSE